jgi:predicted RNase H-like HicB family nuclease
MFPICPGASPRRKRKKRALKLIREAIELHIQALKEDGLPLPQPRSRVEYVEVMLD